jgi:MFS family permease
MANLIVEAVDSTETGVATGMNTIMRTVGGSLGAQVSATIVTAHVIGGTLFASASFVLLAVAHGHPWEFALGNVLMGVGISFAFAAMANLIVEAVDPTETGVATGMNTIMRTVGGSLGGQLAATIVTAHVIAGTHIARESGYTEAFALSAVVMLLAFGATLLVPVRARMHTRVTA